MLAQLYKPFSCRLRQWISNNALIILAVCVVVLYSKRQPFSAFCFSINMLTLVDCVKSYSFWDVDCYFGKPVKDIMFQKELRSFINRYGRNYSL